MPVPQQPTATTSIELVGMDAEPERPLTLYTGDVVTVQTVSTATTELEGLIVDEAGEIHLPLGGGVRVAGMTLGEAEAKIQESLQRFDRFVRANITLTSAAGHVATLVGAVTTPGATEIPPGGRVSDLIARAGGPLSQVSESGEQTVIADFPNARVFREGRQLPISVEKALAEDPRHNILVRPGDRIVVPATTGDPIVVLGRVGTAVPLAYRPGMRLTQALARAGGTTETSDEADIRIIRGDASDPTVYGADLLAIASGDAYDPILAPGDVVFVTEEWTSSAGEVLARIIGPFLGVAGLGVSVALLYLAANPAQ